MYFNILKTYANVTTCPNVEVPGQLANIISIIYNVIRIGIPLILVIYGMLDLGKAVISQKEDDIKKNQKIFVSRLIAAALVFFVFTIVQLVLTLVADDSAKITTCLSDLLNYRG